MSGKIIKSYCRVCQHETSNEVVCEKTKSGDYEVYPEDTSYQIVECRGCESISFRQVYYDLGAAYPTDEDHNDWVVPEEVSIFPKFIKDHHSLVQAWVLPSIVRDIYKESLEAIRSDAKILAGLGLRACIEAVCNDLKIDGRNLETRINKLVSSGYISKKDAERLHGIRFMGNDAAHEIKHPKTETLSVALKIVEHLLLSVYILEKEIEGKIEAAISDHLRFEKLLENKLVDYNKGDEYPLAQYLGKDIRRVSGSILVLENELISRIKNGDYKKLELGKIDHFKGSKEALQHFTLLEKIEVATPIDDYPF